MVKRGIELHILREFTRGNVLMHLLRWSRTQPFWKALGISLVIFIAFVTLRGALPHSSNSYPLLVLTPAAFMTSLMFGLVVTVPCYLVGLLLCIILFVDPVGSIQTSSISNQVGIVVSIGCTLLVSMMTDSIARLTLRLGELIERTQEQEEYVKFRLKEYHHRVKNDLMGLTATLRLSARSYSSDEAKHALASAESRIRSLARIMTRLQPGPEGSIITSDELLTGLIDDFREMVGMRPVAVNMGQIDSFVLPQDTAAPVGLIINELFTNALKHAFPDDRTGFVTISLRRVNGDGHIVVEDNGVGVGEPKDCPHGSGVGQRIIKGLTSQISGQYSQSERPGGGTFCVITFQIPTHQGFKISRNKT